MTFIELTYSKKPRERLFVLSLQVKESAEIWLVPCQISRHKIALSGVRNTIPRVRNLIDGFGEG
ncbi:MAG: hypothetical protein A3H93_20375 [Rhodocyclales bacterium RIFCSPLOWO2_02_FULL_63_24]|nr:MAG: hypothetical protein A3H93_20375 [Rhodocyclales bacterium RIFCSPLOWO2_02_FULL_63_24]